MPGQQLGVVVEFVYWHLQVKKQKEKHREALNEDHKIWIEKDFSFVTSKAANNMQQTSPHTPTTSSKLLLTTTNSVKSFVRQ